MAQFLRPITTITNVAFTGGHAEINESIADDSTRAFSIDGSDAELEVGLSSVIDPSSSTGHIIRYRVAKTDDGILSGSGNAKDTTIRLMQGDTQIGADVIRSLTGSYVTYTWTLTATQADSITDYNALSLEFVTLGGGGNPTNRRGMGISWAEMEIPEAAAAQQLSRTVSDTVVIGSDVITGAKSMIRTALDATSLSEGISRATITFTRTASDSLDAVTDAITRTVQFVRTTTENIAIGVDAVVAEKVRMLFRTASDTVAIGADTVGRTVAFVRTLSDMTIVSDFITTGSLVIRIVADSVLTSDAITRITSMSRSATDITTLTEFVSRAGFLVARTASDTTGVISDSLVRQANKVRTAVDTTVLTESVQRAWSGTRSAVDTLPAIVDSIATSAAVIIYRTVNDTVNVVTDAISRTANMGRGAIDTVTTSDFVERISIYARTVSDSVSDISDFVVRSGVLVRRTVEDSVPLVGDVVGLIKGLSAFVGERIRVFAQRPWFVVRRDGKTYLRHESNRINVRKD